MVGSAAAECRGSSSMPSTRQATASGMLTAKIARQPAAPMSRPPKVGPITTMVCAETASTVSTPPGRSTPERRIRYMAAG